MSSASFPSVELKLHPSPWLVSALVVVAALAMWAIARSALPGWCAAVPPLLAMAALLRYRARHSATLSLGGDGTLRLTGRDGEPRDAARLEVTRRGAFVALRVDVDGRVHRYVLAPDALTHGRARALRLWMARYGGQDVTEAVA